MERRTTIVWGALGSLLAIIFVALLVRSCGRQESDAESLSDGGEVTVAQTAGTSTHVRPCEPDSKTGMCYPRSGNVVADSFNMHSFVAQVQTFGSSSSGTGSSLSSRSSSARSGSQFLDFGFLNESSSSRSSSSSSEVSLPTGFIPSYAGEDSVTIEITNGSSSSRGRSSSSRSSFQARATRTSAGASAGGIFGSGDSVEATGASDGGAVVIANEEGKITDTVADGAVFVTSSGGGSAGSGISGSRCDRSRSLLSIFDFGELTTGSEGWTFPVLLNGDCPVTAAMIRVNKTGGFGGPLDDF